jgi:hypothetical protein
VTEANSVQLGRSMDDSRLTLLPDQSLAPLLPALQGRLTQVGRSITAQNFSSVLDGTMRQLIHGVMDAVGANEGSIWLVDDPGEHLVIAYNNGPNAERLVAQFKQPLTSGLVSMVFSSEQSFIENEVYKNAGQDKTLDSKLKVRTYAMIAVPFYFLNACRGVASCVQLSSPDSEGEADKGFYDNHELVFRNAIVMLGRLIEHWALKRTIGLE